MNETPHDVFSTAVEWFDSGKRVAVATVVKTWGSSPCPVGSQMVINDGCEFEGSVSGGCIEGAVVQEAMQVIEKATPQLLDFGVSNEQAWEVGLACGGSIQIFVEPIE